VTRLLEEVERILGRYDGRRAVALRARLGIDGHRTTLSEASRRANLGTHGVLRLQMQFSARFRSSPAAAELVTRVERLRGASSEPLFLHQLPSRDRWFKGLAVASDLMQLLLVVASAGALDVVDVPGGAVLCKAGLPRWDAIVRGAQAAVRSLPAGSSRRSVRNAVLKTLEAYGASNLISLLLSEVEPSIQYSAAGTIVGFGSTRPMIVKAILHDSDRPLHYSEVARRWSERSGEAINESNAHGALQGCPGVYVFGRGSYGVAKHNPLRGEAVQRLVADCVEFMKRVPGKQWHVSELLEALIASGRRPSLKADKYVIDACLSQSKDLQKLGRLVWTLRRSSMAAARIDLRDAVADALRRAGKPLHLDDLRREIARSRGLNDIPFFVPKTEHVARVAPATWGLVDRDFLLSHRQRESVNHALFDALASRGHPLHLSEIGEVVERIRLPEAVTPYMLMQIAALDGRMRTFRGVLLGLREWAAAPRASGATPRMSGTAPRVQGAPPR
jgi:hypothetical protein